MAAARKSRTDAFATALSVAKAFQDGAQTRKEVMARLGLVDVTVHHACHFLLQRGCIERVGQIRSPRNRRYYDIYSFHHLPTREEPATYVSGPCLLAQHWALPARSDGAVSDLRATADPHLAPPQDRRGISRATVRKHTEAWDRTATARVAPETADTPAALPSLPSPESDGDRYV